MMDKSISKLLKVFSDSQSAVGILAMNWKDTIYKDVTHDIKQAITSLQGKTAKVEISWTREHSSIAGNDVADKLAKEAATEANSQIRGDAKHITIGCKTGCKSVTDHSLADKVGQLRKRQDFVPKKDAKRFLDIPSRRGYCDILQLQTGYSRFNEYRHKLEQFDTDQCDCGDVETTDHFLNHSPIYATH